MYELTGSDAHSIHVSLLEHCYSQNIFI